MPQARIVGADYTLGTLQKLGQRLYDIPLLHFDLTQCPLPDQSVDVVVLLNVLEHIEDDGAAIAQVHRILRRGGPSSRCRPDLISTISYDRGLIHFRRYDMVDRPLWIITGHSWIGPTRRGTTPHHHRRQGQRRNRNPTSNRPPGHSHRPT
jgi:hypothetical protein